LIHTGVGFETLHVRGIRVAPTAEIGNLADFRDTAVGIRGVGRIHGGVHVLGQLRILVAAMAIVTRQVDLRMNSPLHVGDNLELLWIEQVGVAVTGRA
jgi:hypothetical protein